MLSQDSQGGSVYGEMIPTEGGDNIPLRKQTLIVGRRANCDIVLRFADVSTIHCLLTLGGGYWFVKDLHSRSGTAVNGVPIQEERLEPGDILGVGKRSYRVDYSPTDNLAMGR